MSSSSGIHNPLPVILPTAFTGGSFISSDPTVAAHYQTAYGSGDWNANRKDAGTMASNFFATASTSGTTAAFSQLFQQAKLNSMPTNWGGVNGPIEATPGTSFYNEFNRPIFDYDSNISAEALFKANATPAMLDIYNQLPPDQQRAMQVQAVLNHLEVVNQIATNFIKWNKETLMATVRNIV